MKALVLDFDGVISDSVRESFTVALGSYLDLQPTSSLDRRDRDELYQEFLELIRGGQLMLEADLGRWFLGRAYPVYGEDLGVIGAVGALAGTDNLLTPAAWTGPAPPVASKA